MKAKYIFTVLTILFLSLTVFSQEDIYSENLDRPLKQNEIVRKIFMVNTTNNLSFVSLQIKGFDKIEDNIFPVVTIKINNSLIFSGTLSDYTFGKNNKYGDFEINITDYIKKGSNSFSIEYAGLTGNSYVFIKNLDLVKKIQGFDYKTIADFNYDEKLYTEYLKKALTLESTVSATENYQVIKKGMHGTYYGESTYNPKFGCIKWSKNLNKNVQTNKHYPQEYKSYAFNVPFAFLKIKKSRSLDNKEPQLISNSVENYFQTENININISGNVSDSSGMYAVYVNRIKANLNNGNFNLNIPLAIGNNSISIKAFDNFGNLSRKEITVIRNRQPNNSAPILTINYPKQTHLIVTTNIFEILGSADDDNNISYIQVIANKNLFKIFARNNQDFKIPISLLKGENNIEIYAVDETNNESEHKNFKINFEPQYSKPVITLVNPIGVENNDTLLIDKDFENLPISVKIEDKLNISSVNIDYINTPVSIPLNNTGSSIYTENIRLPNASVININITATNIYNSQSTFSFILKRRKTEDLFPNIDLDIPVVSDKKCEDCYALVIGNSKYDPNKTLFDSLPYAANDAIVFAKYLMNTMNIPSSNIKLVNDAGISDFMSETNTFLKKIKNNPNGKFLFYYSGHGAVNKSHSSYFVPVDFNEINDPYGILIKSLFVDSVIYNMLKAQPSKLTVILDMCYGLKGAKGVGVETDNSFDFDGPIVIFAASHAEAYSFKRRNHSLFTYALLKLLHDTNGDITYKDLDTEIQKTMNSIIENEKLPFSQEIIVKPSSVLNNNWESWKLP